MPIPAGGNSLIVGASGAVGRFLLSKLEGAPQSLFAVSRKSDERDDENVVWLQGDLFGDMPDLADANIETIYSVGPLDGLARWLGAVRLPVLRRIVALSSMSVEVKADSSDAMERALAVRLRRAENEVIAFCQSNAVACVLLRPTLIYGAGVDRSVSALARFGQRWRVFPTISGATGLRQPIHADDLAAACIAAASAATNTAKIFAVGGGEQLSFADMLRRIRANLGVRTMPAPIPLVLARSALRLLRLHPRWRYLREGLIDRLQVDQIVDNGAAFRELHWRPRRFMP